MGALEERGNGISVVQVLNALLPSHDRHELHFVAGNVGGVKLALDSRRTCFGNVAGKCDLPPIGSQALGFGHHWSWTNFIRRHGGAVPAGLSVTEVPQWNTFPEGA